MLSTPRSRWIAAVSVAALLVAAGVAVAGDGQGRRGAGKPRGRAFGRLIRERRARMARAMERISSLSDEQAKAAFDAAKDLGRMRDEIRAKRAALLLQAHRDAKAAPEKREAIRESARMKLRALREEYKAPFTEAGLKVVRTLTPEQRAKIDEAAKRRGKTVTDEGLARRMGMRLSRPWAEALLRARVEKGGATPAAK